MPPSRPRFLRSAAPLPALTVTVASPPPAAKSPRGGGRPLSAYSSSTVCCCPRCAALTPTSAPAGPPAPPNGFSTGSEARSSASSGGASPDRESSYSPPASAPAPPAACCCSCCCGAGLRPRSPSSIPPAAGHWAGARVGSGCEPDRRRPPELGEASGEALLALRRWSAGSLRGRVMVRTLPGAPAGPVMRAALEAPSCKGGRLAAVGGWGGGGLGLPGLLYLDVGCLSSGNSASEGAGCCSPTQVRAKPPCVRGCSPQLDLRGTLHDTHLLLIGSLIAGSEPTPPRDGPSHRGRVPRFRYSFA